MRYRKRLLWRGSFYVREGFRGRVLARYLTRNGALAYIQVHGGRITYR